jgi:hypothetical protein
MQSQGSQSVWTSWPGGIGYPTPIPLKGGKSKKTRKGRKASKKTRKMRRGTRRMRGGNKVTSFFFGNERSKEEKNAVKEYNKQQAERVTLQKKIRNLETQRSSGKYKNPNGTLVRQGSAAASARQAEVEKELKNLQVKLNNL